MLRRIRLLLWLLVALAVAAGIYVYARGGPTDQPVTTTTTSDVNSLGGPFTLTGSDGKPFASRELAGKPFAIFFGFTHCPDVCPTTLARLARLRGQLGKGAEAFNIVFVSVDPERDTPAEMARYATLFDTPVIALTGTPAEIAAIKKAYGIFSEKVPDANGGYSVDHTATVLLMDEGGKFVATIAPDEGDAAALAKLERLTA